MKLRAQRRLPTRFPTVADGPEGPLDVVVVDITEGGAKIDGLSALAPGTVCHLHVLSDTVQGTVRWSAGTCAGVAFERKLTPHQLDVIRHRRTPRLGDAPKPRRAHGFTELR